MKRNSDLPQAGTANTKHEDPLYWHYRTIGNELIALEVRGSWWSISGYSSEDLLEFRRGVTFVPLEVLSSYLDDLLDLEVNDDRLFIQQRSRASAVYFWIATLMCAAGFVCASLAFDLFHGVHAAALVVSPPLFIVALGLLLFTPYRGLRRLGFARVVSREISRRKGDGSDEGVVLFPLRGGFLRRSASTASVASRSILRSRIRIVRPDREH